MKLHTKLLALATIAAALTTSVKAISYDAGTDGVTAPGGATFTATYGGNPASLGTKTQDGWTVLGVADHTAGNEIGPYEALTITFDSALHYNTLTLGLLFDGPEYHDVYEIAAALTDGSSHVFTLKATGATTALWDGSSSGVTNLSPAAISKGAVWQITNPFGDMKITSLKLYPVDSAEFDASGDPKKSHSDFGLVAFSAPDAASTLSLLGLGLIGLTMIGRRSRR